MIVSMLLFRNEYGDNRMIFGKCLLFFEGNLEAKIKRWQKIMEKKLLKNDCSEYIEAYNKISKGS